MLTCIPEGIVNFLPVELKVIKGLLKADIFQVSESHKYTIYEIIPIS